MPYVYYPAKGWYFRSSSRTKDEDKQRRNKQLSLGAYCLFGTVTQIVHQHSPV